MKKFTVIDEQTEIVSIAKRYKYKRIHSEPLGYRSIDDFKKHADDLYSDWNTICLDENGDMYAVMFDVDTKEPLLWQRCEPFCLKKFTVIDEQTEWGAVGKKYKRVDFESLDYRSTEDFFKHSDDFFDDWNTVCVDENGDMYAVMFDVNTKEPLLWQRCEAIR